MYYAEIMAKTRLTISIEEADAARIKAAAARADRDVSSYISAATMEMVERDERTADIFADIDAQIAEAESAAAAMSGATLAAEDPISAAEKERIIAKWQELLGPERGRGAA